MSDLHGETRGYLESSRAVIVGQERLAEGFANFFDDQSDYARTARLFRDVSQLLSNHGRQPYDEAYRHTVADPITRFNVLFPECEELAKKRAKKALDYDLAKTKVRREIDKPSSDPNRLPDLEKEAKYAEEIYEDLNSLLIEGIEHMCQISSDYSRPSLNAHLRLSQQWTSDVHRQVDGLRITNRAQHDDIDQALTELKALPILNM